MKRFYFRDYEDFAEHLTDKFHIIDDRSLGICVIAKYHDASAIISELIRCGFNATEIDLHLPDFNDYEDEYYIKLTGIYNEMEVWCEPAKHGNVYFNDEASYAYVMPDCSSTILPHCLADEKYEVYIDGDDFELEEYPECYRCRCCEDDECEDDGTITVYVNGGKAATKIKKDDIAKFLDREMKRWDSIDKFFEDFF